MLFRVLVSTTAVIFGSASVSFSETHDRPSRERPSITISQAARAAEAELERRGLADGHFISSIRYVRTAKDVPRHYRVIIAPPVVLNASATKDPDKQKYLEFRIDMSGVVSAAEFQLRESHQKLRLEVEQVK